MCFCQLCVFGASCVLGCMSVYVFRLLSVAVVFCVFLCVVVVFCV